MDSGLTDNSPEIVADATGILNEDLYASRDWDFMIEWLFLWFDLILMVVAKLGL